MRLVILNKKTLFTIIIALLLIIISIITLVKCNKSKDVFNPDAYYQGNIDDKIMAFAW